METEWRENTANRHQQAVRSIQHEVPPFKAEEIQCAIKKLRNGKSPVLDGVHYEALKSEYEKHKKGITSCFNACLILKMVPSGWKHVIQRIPKKSFQQHDLTTLRDMCVISDI